MCLYQNLLNLKHCQNYMIRSFSEDASETFFSKTYENFLSALRAYSNSSLRPSNCSRIFYPLKWKNIHPWFSMSGQSNIISRTEHLIQLKDCLHKSKIISISYKYLSTSSNSHARAFWCWRKVGSTVAMTCPISPNVTLNFQMFYANNQWVIS